MAKCFQITTNVKSDLSLDSLGRASCQITAKNVTGAACDGRAVPVSIPVTSPASGAVQNGWIKIDAPEQHFERDQEKVFVAKIEVPKDKAKPGKYQFAVDVVLVATPDVGDRSQTIAFTVPEKVVKPPIHIPGWVIPVVLVVVVVLGVGLWLALRSSGPTVPDLHGQTLSQADGTLKSAGLMLDQDVQTAESKVEDSGKITEQRPVSGQKATKGQAVQVTVGAQMVAVPQLIGHSFQEVLAILGDKKLAVGQAKTAQNPNFAGGVVFDQSPAAQQVVKSGSAVDVQVTPLMVTVPNVVGQRLGDAVNTLKQLSVTSLSGDYNNQTVISQNPAPGASVPVGSPVALAFPVVFSCGGINCIYQGNFVRLTMMNHAALARELEQQKVPPK
jgi:hypothetical protein